MIRYYLDWDAGATAQLDIFNNAKDPSEEDFKFKYLRLPSARRYVRRLSTVNSQGPL